ncbi:ferredoxin [Streptomyces sp. JJ36]|nr:ferredoxin [Streptomyces sp. JJ36]
MDRVAHLTVHGGLPDLRLEELMDLAENIALRGRGGAGFPFVRKLRAVVDAAGRQGADTAVVVNGSEGEPSCLKDAALLLYAPHLVLDGAVLCANALGAREVALGVTRGDVERSLQEALAERGPDGPRIRVGRLPERFVTGESSALTSGLDDGPALPTGSPVRTSERGLRGLPTLFSNTETYAQIAVAARLGALGFRETGLPGEPGTVLLTVAGEHVVEAPTGALLTYVLDVCGTAPGQGVLVGGYHGRWLTPEGAAEAVISRQSLSSLGATLGAGAVLPLPEDTCPVAETVAVTAWLAGESAGQCGPCALGLPALADALRHAADGGGTASLEAVRTRMRAVEKRGACSHPDGSAGFVSSALGTFPDEFERHAEGAGCGRGATGALPLPGGPPGGRSAPREEQSTSRLVVDWTRCRGHGLCADVAPDLLGLDRDGFPDRARSPVPDALRRQALRAVRRCPELALRLEG